jgi:hypothetical protein
MMMVQQNLALGGMSQTKVELGLKMILTLCSNISVCLLLVSMVVLSSILIKRQSDTGTSMTLAMEVNGPILIAQTKAIGASMTEVATLAHGGTKTESQVGLGQQIPQTRL